MKRLVALFLALLLPADGMISALGESPQPNETFMPGDYRCTLDADGARPSRTGSILNSCQENEQGWA